MIREYYKITRKFKCNKCGMYFTQSFWKWRDICFDKKNKLIYNTKCPYCKNSRWSISCKEKN